METPEQTLRGVLQTIENAAKLAGRPKAVRLLAVSKTRTWRPPASAPLARITCVKARPRPLNWRHWAWNGT